MMRIGVAGLAAVTAIVAGSFPTHAQSARVNGAPGMSGKRAMTFADLMAMKRVSDPQISPSGRWVLFSVTDVSLDKNTKTNHLWVVPLNTDGAQPTSQNRDVGHPGAERQETFGPGESFGRFSPDGSQVSWTQEPGKDESFARIAIAAWDEKTGKIGAGKALTGVSGDADGAVWSPDSKRLMLTTQVWPECSVKQPTLHDETVKDGPPGSVGGIEIGGTRDVAAWKGMQPAAWAEEDACDKAKDEAAAKNPVKAQAWDGLLYRHWDQFTGVKRTHILLMDSGGGNVRDVTTARDVGDAETPTWMLGGPQEYAWAPDSKEIAYVTNLDPVPAASTNNDVFTLRVDEADARPVKVSTSPGSDDEPEYSLDGKWLAFRSQRQAGFESDKFDLVVMNRASQEVTDITRKFDSWVDEFTWASNSLDLVFAFPVAGEESISSARVNSPKELTGGQVIGYEGELGSLVFAANSEILVGTQMTVAKPTELFVYDPKHLDPKSSSRNEWGGERQLTHLNDALLTHIDLASLEPFWFMGAEGTKVEGFLLKPPGFDAAKKYPVKFLMHGGPQTAWGDAWSYRWNWELMAASGYVVIGINRRGSTGYGQKFVDEVSGDWGGRAYEDLMKGLDYAEAKYPFIDKTRECALGASYGGFMADWILTHTHRFKCIVTHDGLYDAGAAWGSTEEMWFPEWEFRRPEDYPKGWDGFSATYDPMGAHGGTGRTVRSAVTGSSASGSFDSARSRLAQDDGGLGSGHAAEPWRYAGLPASEDPFRKWSPKEYIQNAKTPTLIIHSQKDYRLDVSQGFELYTALQRLGVPSRFLYFPDESHWVLKPKDSELWNAVVSDWCDRWTKTGKYAEQ